MSIKDTFLNLVLRKTKASNDPVKRKTFEEYESEYIENVRIGRCTAFDAYALSIKESLFANLEKFGFDLVCFHDYGGGCCDECIKHKGRVYSVSGKSKKFPPLPNYAKKHGNFHFGCRCTMSPYFDEGTVFLHGERVDAVKSSNRPYADNRNDKEKELYNNFLSRMHEEAKEEASKEWDREEYNTILKLFPEDAPKSFGAYRRMKKGNSVGFQDLKRKAADYGITI